MKSDLEHKKEEIFALEKKERIIDFLVEKKDYPMYSRE
jgi:hypothetical protein